MNRENMLRPNRAAQVAAFLSVSAAVASAWGGAFISGNDLVVARIGDGVTTYSGAAPVFLDEYNISGATPLLVNTVPFLATGTAAGAATLTETFSLGGRDGYLTLSPNGQYLAFAGYRKDAGTADPSGDTATATPRVVGIVGATGVPDTSTALTNYASSTVFRSAVTTDGTSIYVTDNGTGANSIAYTTKGSASAAPIAVTGAVGFRSVNVASGKLYGSTGSTPKGTFAISDSTGTLPTGSANPATQTEITRGTSTDSVSDAVFLDLSPTVPGVDTAYLAESAGFAKFSLVGSTWTYNGTLAATGTIDGVAAQQQGSSVALLLGTDSAIYKVADTGYNTAIPSSLGSAYLSNTNTAINFRGIAFAPSVPEPSSIAIVAAGATFFGKRRRRH